MEYLEVATGARATLRAYAELSWFDDLLVSTVAVEAGEDDSGDASAASYGQQKRTRRLRICCCILAVGLLLAGVLVLAAVCVRRSSLPVPELNFQPWRTLPPRPADTIQMNVSDPLIAWFGVLFDLNHTEEVLNSLRETRGHVTLTILGSAQDIFFDNFVMHVRKIWMFGTVLTE
jgi:hypothetical protein